MKLVQNCTVTRGATRVTEITGVIKSEQRTSRPSTLPTAPGSLLGKLPTELYDPRRIQHFLRHHPPQHPDLPVGWSSRGGLGCSALFGLEQLLVFAARGHKLWNPEAKFSYLIAEPKEVLVFIA